MKIEKDELIHELERRSVTGLGWPRYNSRPLRHPLKFLDWSRVKPAASRRSADGSRAFTLIELLVVIAIMAVLAGFTLMVVHGIKKNEYVGMASAELGDLETALENYHSQYGVYPPSNSTNPLTNALYYELSGVTNVVKGGVNSYETLDGASTVNAADYATLFGVGGAINCAKTGDTESAKAQDFIQGLSSKRFAPIIYNNNPFDLLITAARGPDATYRPLGANYQDLNPVRYVYPGTNNPSSYDLWIQLVFSGKTNLICNWSKSVIVNSPLP